MLRTIFEAEFSPSPTEGLLGKEQQLDVLKTSALNHIPTGRRPTHYPSVFLSVTECPPLSLECVFFKVCLSPKAKMKAIRLSWRRNVMCTKTDKNAEVISLKKTFAGCDV